MKKVLIGLVVIVVLIGGVVTYVFSNLNDLVKKGIETAGSDAVGSDVRVDSVDLDLVAGTAAIYGFSIANPEGFSNAEMVSFEELSVAIDLESISNGDVIRINSIVARNPFVRFEEIDGRSNIDAMNERFASDEVEEEATESSEPGPIIAIDSLLIERIEGVLATDRLPDPVEVDLGDIRLQDLEGTPEEIAEQVMVPVMSQLSSTVATALLSSLAGISVEDVQAQVEEQVEELQEQAEAELDELEDNLNNQLDEAIGEDAREGLGNLIRGL